MSADRGELVIVLHTHMPFVTGFGTWPAGEEWLWEAAATSYERLFDALRGQPVTIGLTPVLCDQFEAMRGPAGDRYLNYLRELRGELFAQEMVGFRKGGKHAEALELERAVADYTAAADRFEALGRDLNGRFAELAGDGRAELWTSSATHAILPLIATRQGLDLQIQSGIDSHLRRFNDWNGGFWLPECAFAEGIDAALARNGVKVFCADRSGTVAADSLDHLEPVQTPAGPIALTHDWATMSLVWQDGAYPAADAYRSTFKRSTHGLMPWQNGGGVYDEPSARAQARAQARDFVERVIARLDRFRVERGKPGVSVCALDTELLGHWWYEGPWWLEAVFDEACRQGLRLATASDAVARNGAVGRQLPQRSSWGENRDLSTWDSPAVANYPWQTRAAELAAMRSLAHARAADAGVGDLDSSPESGAITAVCRELLALQSSDWAFMVSQQRAGEYPEERFSGHLGRLASFVENLSQSLDPATGEADELALLAPDLAIKSLTF